MRLLATVNSADLKFYMLRITSSAEAKPVPVFLTAKSASESHSFLTTF